MKRFALRLSGILAMAGLTASVACAADSITRDSGPLGALAPAGSPKANWTADNGNGTYSNPLFYEEFEDPDPLRVGEDYYLAGTTMHMNPGLIIMHSKDLVNWELASYCIEKLDLGPQYRLEGGNIYGRGIWAPCIRYHNGMFYVFCNVNNAGLQVFRSKSAYGPWEHNTLPGRHDLSVLFDDDLNKIFLISGGHSPYPIEELAPDIKSFVSGARHQLVVPPDQKFGEGHHLYKIKGKYYDISALPGPSVNQMIARADSIDGPWTVTAMIDGESLGTPTGTPSRATPNNRGFWLHQGGMCDTPSGDWWCIIMGQHGGAGRMVNLVPITWDNDFPLVGLPGNLRKAPLTWIKPNTGFKQEPKPAFVHDDTFDNARLNPLWQWNHVEDDAKWSLTERPGALRLHSLPATDFYSARNTLCQRPPGPESTMTVELNTSGMTNGDIAGLGLVSAPYAWIGVSKSAEGSFIRMLTGPAPGRRNGGGTNTAAIPTNPPAASVPYASATLWLRVHCDFDFDRATFSWSADGRTFAPLGNPFTTTFQLTTFQGVRPGLFHFNATGQAGGYADFDNYTVDQPRARGIEREIPLGKTIVLTSGADGSFLFADAASNRLVNVAADAGGAVPPNAKFQVLDVGLGRVALKAVNGKFLSAADAESVVLKDLGNAKPGDGESFQWINLMRGDAMLMSLVNHQYLATKPNSPGPVTVNALGATAARKSGAEFKWKVAN
jgi:xylan 1,4-beta-xylosidase